ncbi:ac92-like [Fopius arisanus]|uniref:Sulfhydryl oxidase n=1 Tax=Fopius arisanus TaxID=64838 RepID=A0A0C9QRS5_9HYME|nr:ac92-like [Fopius arisanus]
MKKQEKPLPLEGILSLLRQAKEELKNTDISIIVRDFQEILDEFWTYSEQLRLANPSYNKIMTQFVDKLCTEYNLTLNLMYVRVNQYSTDMWGPIYWRFFHLASILVAHALHNKRINDVLNFPTLIYNIDCILPCSICTSHYLSLKPTNRVKLTVKDMSFGLVMSGMQTFHNLVTENINKVHKAQPHGPPASRYFGVIDFAKTYHCIEIPPPQLLKSSTWVRPRIDWQSKTHNILCTLLALSTHQLYLQCSQLMKNIAYADENVIVNKNLSRDSPPTTQAQNTVRILTLIAQAIKLQVDKKVISNNLDFYSEVIEAFYGEFPDISRELVNTLPNSTTMPQTEIDIRNELKRLSSEEKFNNDVSDDEDYESNSDIPCKKTLIAIIDKLQRERK